MGWGTGNLGGGGGASLNFDVKTYSTEAALLAATPKENTIGIITTTAITSWVFSAVEPAEPVEGMVWISTGTSSAVEFNAVKKNSLQVYPISVKQYVGGTGADVTAMSYQGGAWKKWINYLYNAGDQYTDITGGWSNAGYNNPNFTTTVPVYNDSSITIASNGTKSAGLAGTYNQIDLTDVQKIKILYTGLDTVGGAFLRVCKTKSYVTADAVAEVKVTTLSDEPVELSVNELTGNYYVFVVVYGSSADSTQSATFESIWTE